MADTRSEAPVRADLSALFRDHGDGLAGAVRNILGPRAETQEVLQEAFLRAWRFLGVRAAPRDPLAWLFVVVMNTAKDLRRRRRHRPPHVSLKELAEMNDHTAGPVAQLEQREALDAARIAIHGLRDHEKDVFTLRVSGGLTFEATAEALGIPVGTAKTRMRSALAHLRVTLSDHAPAANASRRTS